MPTASLRDCLSMSRVRDRLRRTQVQMQPMARSSLSVVPKRPHSSLMPRRTQPSLRKTQARVRRTWLCPTWRCPTCQQTRRTQALLHRTQEIRTQARRTRVRRTQALLYRTQEIRTQARRRSSRMHPTSQPCSSTVQTHQRQWLMLCCRTVQARCLMLRSLQPRRMATPQARRTHALRHRTRARRTRARRTRERRTWARRTRAPTRPVRRTKTTRSRPHCQTSGSERPIRRAPTAQMRQHPRRHSSSQRQS
jgi:hypothetical protein